MSLNKLFATSVLFLASVSMLAACSDKKEKDDEPLAVTTSNLEGSWIFVRSESVINGETTYIEEPNYEVNELPLGLSGLQAYNLNFQKNYLNGFTYTLNGNNIQWSLMSPVQSTEIAIVVASLTEEFLVLHYEYQPSVEGTLDMTGYSDIMYRKIDMSNQSK